MDNNKKDNFENDNPYNSNDDFNNNEEKNINNINNEISNNKEVNNINNNENTKKSIEDLYNNCDINDFSNPFKDYQNDSSNKENKTNFNDNNVDNGIFNDGKDNDFSNPFKDFKFEEQQTNNINPSLDKNKFNQINNSNNSNSNNFNNNNNQGNQFANPFLDNVNDQKQDNGFSNPFKNEFGFNDINGNNNKIENNNEFFKNQNNYNNQNNFFNNNINFINNINNNKNFQQNTNINNDFNNNLNNNINNKANNNNFQNSGGYANTGFNNNNNNFPNKEEIKDAKTSKDYKTIESIIKKCESLYNTAQINYENFKIKESIATLEKINNTLISTKLTITTQKKELSCFLPKIENLENLTTTTINNYRLDFYEAISKKFKLINASQFNPNNDSLTEFCSKFILYNPFISFDDIYNSDNIIESFMEKLAEARRYKKKCILLFGDRGAGKTLLVHAYAKKMGGSVAQIEGDQCFKIPYFAKEFVKICFNNVDFNKPMFIYVRNIEQMQSCTNQFDYIYDKVSSSYNLNIYFIASTSVIIQKLPRIIYDKFQFFQEVKTVETKNKADFMMFLCNKFNIKLNVNSNELNDFVNQNLDNFPNKKIYELIKCSINLKMQKAMKTNETYWVYKEGINLNDLTNALSLINPFL